MKNFVSEVLRKKSPVPTSPITKSVRGLYMKGSPQAKFDIAVERKLKTALAEKKKKLRSFLGLRNK